VDEQNLAMENVVGATSGLIMNWDRRTSGVERVSSGWMSECRTVGTAREDGQRYDGKLRSVETVRREAREAVEVITKLCG
jgi:hypothetical protein